MKPTPSPASTSLTPLQEECKDLWYRLQSGKEYYMETKNRYGELDCDRILGDAKPVAPPPAPLDIATRCKMYRANVATMTGMEEPKDLAYMESMAAECAAYP